MRRAARLLLLSLCVGSVPGAAFAAAPTARAHPGKHSSAKPHARLASRGGGKASDPTRQPAAPADAFAAAPVPDPDISPPVLPEDRDPHVTPTLFHLTNAYDGNGYVYGSSPQGMDDKRALTIPGVMLAVPLR